VGGEHMVWIDLAEDGALVQYSWCSDEVSIVGVVMRSVLLV